MGNTHSTTTIVHEADHSPVIKEILSKMAELDTQMEEYNRILTPGQHNLEVARQRARTNQIIDQLDLQLMEEISVILERRRQADRAERNQLEDIGLSAPREGRIQLFQMMSQSEIPYPTTDEIFEWLKKECQRWAKPAAKGGPPTPQDPSGSQGPQNPPPPPGPSGIQGA